MITNFKKQGLYYLSSFNRAPSPRSAIIELTTRCNLHCKMCPRTIMDITKKDMSYENFCNIIAKVPKLRNIALLGPGETMMYPQLSKVIEHIKKQNINLEITTNGTLLSAKKIEDSHLSLCDQLNISIDSVNPEIYKEIRGIDLKVVTSNLFGIRNLLPNTHIKMQTLLFPNTLSSLNYYVDFAQKYRIKEINFIIPINFKNNPESELSINNARIVLSKLVNYGRQKDVIINGTPLLDNPRPCLYPWYTLRIAINGDIYPCCYIYNIHGTTWDECINGQKITVQQDNYRMGNLLDNNISDFWNHQKYKKLRRTVRRTSPRCIPSNNELFEMRHINFMDNEFDYCRKCLFRLNKAC